MSDLSASDLRLIGAFVNNSTGRASLGAGNFGRASQFLAETFFSPRYYVSRFMSLLGTQVWLHEAKAFGGEGASWQARGLMAEEYGKQVGAVLGVLSIIGMGLTAMLGSGGPDEDWEFFWNPNSPNFGSFRIGKSYYDFTARTAPLISLGSRLATGKTHDRLGDTPANRGTLLGRHLRGKLSPVAGGIVDVLTQDSLSREKVGSRGWFLNLFAPISPQNALKFFQTERPLPAAVGSLVEFFGGAVRVQEPRVEDRKHAAAELNGLRQRADRPGTSPTRRVELKADVDRALERHLVEAVKDEASRDGDAKLKAEAEAYKPGQKLSDTLKQAVEKERHDIALKAGESLSAEQFPKDFEWKVVDERRAKARKSDKGDAGIQASRDLLKAIAPNRLDRENLLKAAWLSKHSGLTDDYYAAKRRLP